MTTTTAPDADCYAPKSWVAVSDAWLMRVAFGLTHSGDPAADVVERRSDRARALTLPVPA